jgi:hypothetical protein
MLPNPGAAYRIGEDQVSGLAALRDFGPAKDRSGSFSTEAAAPGKAVEVGCT